MQTRPNTKARLMFLAAAGIALTTGPARSGVTVGFDAASLNELLPAMTVNEVIVPLGEANSLTILLKDLEIRGFDPAAGEGRTGHVLTAVRLQVPQLGIETLVAPRLSVNVLREKSGSTLELRFEEALLSLPLVGSIDVAAFLPPLEFSADNVFLVNGMQGDIRVRSRLAGVEMGRKVLRFDFDLEAVAPGGR